MSVPFNGEINVGNLVMMRYGQGNGVLSERHIMELECC